MPERLNLFINVLMKMSPFFCSPPNDKKSFCSIEGEWNGVMYAKGATGVSFITFSYCFSDTLSS